MSTPEIAEEVGVTDTTLRPGDLLTVYSAEGATPEVTDVFGHYEDKE
jgi:trk system potassium uptake protein TrkA